MVDKYRCFRDLSAVEREGKDFKIRLLTRQSSVAVVAPHGGTIEPTTSELAVAIAGDAYSLYCFEGLLPNRPHGDLHITSERFDEPTGRALAAASSFVVAVHGRKDGDDPQTVWLGGRDDALVAFAGGELSKVGFSTKSVTGGALSGKAPANICNAGTSGAGLQLELSRTLRDQLRGSADLLDTFAAAVRAAIEARFADGHGQQ